MLDSDEEIGPKLMKRLRIAKGQKVATAKAFDAIVREVPSGLPHPDGAFRVEQAGKESRRALMLYAKALRQYTDFLLYGVVPEDL